MQSLFYGRFCIVVAVLYISLSLSMKAMDDGQGKIAGHDRPEPELSTMAYTETETRQRPYPTTLHEFLVLQSSEPLTTRRCIRPEQTELAPVQAHSSCGFSHLNLPVAQERMTMKLSCQTPMLAEAVVSQQGQIPPLQRPVYTTLPVMPIQLMQLLPMQRLSKFQEGCDQASRYELFYERFNALFGRSASCPFPGCTFKGQKIKDICEHCITKHPEVEKAIDVPRQVLFAVQTTGVLPSSTSDTHDSVTGLASQSILIKDRDAPSTLAASQIDMEKMTIVRNLASEPTGELMLLATASETQRLSDGSHKVAQDKIIDKPQEHECHGAEEKQKKTARATFKCRIPGCSVAAPLGPLSAHHRVHFKKIFERCGIPFEWKNNPDELLEKLHEELIKRPLEEVCQLLTRPVAEALINKQPST